MNTLSYTKNNQHIVIAMQDNEQGNISITRTIHNKLNTLSVAIRKGENITDVIIKVNTMLAMPDADLLRLINIYNNSVIGYAEGDSVMYDGRAVIILNIVSPTRVRIVYPNGNTLIVYYTELKLKPL